jgi:7-carboxy-7-deazaguanine synthase
MASNLPVNELFFTIQGEANWTGTPSIFIRLQGCPVGCPWCDTKHTWALPKARAQVSLDEVLEKTADKPTPAWALVDVEDLIAMIDERWPSVGHFVITGGEPCLHDLEPLTSLLFQRGTVQIETSGTQMIRAVPAAWITVSPKLLMPGGYPVAAEALRRADEVKMPIETETDVKRLAELCESHIRPETLVWMQPVSQGAWANQICLAAAMEYGWNISFQTHKYVGLR